MEAGVDQDFEASVASMIHFLTLVRTAGGWVGQPPEWEADYLFGGFVIAQALMAASRDAPSGTRIHSMHGYFLRPVATDTPVSYRLTDIRPGRSFTTRHLRAEQRDKAVFDMTCSFTTDGTGYLYDLPAPATFPAVDDGTSELGPGPWESAQFGPSAPAPDGTMESTHRMWFRLPADLPDDPHLHTALLGFATDWTGIGGRPMHLEGDTQGMVSLDHAAWFHRPARVDGWLSYDVQSLVNASGRGLLRGVIRGTDGKVVASAAQEMLLAVI